MVLYLNSDWNTSCLFCSSFYSHCAFFMSLVWRINCSRVVAEPALRMGCIEWLTKTDELGAFAWGGREPGLVKCLGEQARALLCRALCSWCCCTGGKFAADRLHCSSFGGCFCLGLLCLRPVRWFSSFNCSFCLMRTTLSSSLTAHALSWLPGPWSRNG